MSESIRITADLPELFVIVTESWIYISKFLGTEGSLDAYLTKFVKYLANSLSAKVTVNLKIITMYRGPLLPKPENPHVLFTLESPDVIVTQDVCGDLHVNITMYTPRPPFYKAEQCIIYKVISHELVHMYLDLEFLKTIKKENLLQRTHCTIAIDDSALLLEETFAETVSNNVIDSIKSCSHIIEDISVKYYNEDKRYEIIVKKNGAILQDQVFHRLVSARSLSCSVNI